MKLISLQEGLETLKSKRLNLKNRICLFYSSVLGGASVHPEHFVVPIDDHMVHRGDAVFEAFKSEFGCIYLLDEHIQRLYQSAQSIELQMAVSPTQLKDIILSCARLTNQPNLHFRLFASRGYGSFSPNPYDTQGAEIYLALIEAPQKSGDLQIEPHAKKIGTALSKVPIKVAPWPQIKSCNYLPNVLMKKEAIDSGLDYVINATEDGILGEGATENFFFINNEGRLCVPEASLILKGTTLTRFLSLIETRLEEFELQSIEVGRYTRQDLQNALEAYFIGTTIDLVPVAEFNALPLPKNTRYFAFRQILRRDIEITEPQRHPRHCYLSDQK